MAKRSPRRYLGILFLALFLNGCGLNLLPPADTRSLAVGYLPGLVKGRKPAFPPVRILVLLPADGRQDLTIRDGTLGSEIIGIHGLNSRQGQVSIAARNLIPDLGVLRVMDSGMSHPPDIPQSIYALAGLPGVMQEAITTHFCEAGFHVEPVSFSLPIPPAKEKKYADYVLSCRIEEFSLLSLARYQQLYIHSAISSHLISLPVRGPTQAAVSLTLSLYRWPSGKILWQGEISDIVDDPTLGDSIHLYASAEETLTMALSRVVGSILIDQSLQDILLRPWLHHRPALAASPWCSPPLLAKRYEISPLRGGIPGQSSENS